MKSPHYIVIEGVIGAGKSDLATLLSKRLGSRLVLEKHEENPFLADFYKKPQRYAFQTQMFFLLSRYRQQLDMRQRDLFHPMVITDCLFARDRIFASLTLEEREFILYEKVASLLEREIPRPDLVVYLQANTLQLMTNIKKRGRSYEKNIAESYVRSLVEAYNNFFFNYKKTSLLVVDITQTDFVNRQRDLDNLIEQIMMPLGGIKFYIPRLE